MGEVYFIRGREVTQEEYLQFEKALKEEGIDTEEVFKDKMVLGAEIDRFLDFNQDGKAETIDFYKQGVSRGASLFTRLGSLFRRHGLHIKDYLEDTKSGIEAIKMGELERVPPLLWQDKDFVLEVIKLDTYNALSLASQDLQGDREVVLEAVKKDGYALQWASSLLRGDKEIVMAAIKQAGEALQFASDDLKGDREVALAAVSNDESALNHVAEPLRNNSHFLEEALKCNAKVFQYFDSSFKKNRHLAFSAVLIDVSNYLLIDPSLQTDRMLAQAAVIKDGMMLRCLADKFKRDRQIVLLAVRENGLALQYASEEMKQDLEVVLTAAKEDARALLYTTAPFRANPELALQFIEANPETYIYFDRTLKENREIALAAIRKKGLLLKVLPPLFSNDREFVLTAVRQDGLALAYVASFQDDLEIVLEAVKESGLALQFASKRAQKDRNIAFAAVRQHGRAFTSTDLSLRGDKELALLAVSRDEEMYREISRELQTDSSFLLQGLVRNIHLYDKLWLLLPDRRRLALWQGALRIAELRGVQFPPVAKNGYHDFIKYLREKGITNFPKRFHSFQTIYEVIKNREEPFDPKDQRPVALFLYNKDDHNRAFEARAYPLIDTFVTHGRFRVLYYEVSDENEVISLLKSFQDNGKKIHTLTLAGHGTPETLALGGADLGLNLPNGDPFVETEYLDRDDFQEGDLDILKSVMAPHGQIFLYSCSNGKGGRDAKNIANGVAMTLPGVDILSMSNSSNIKRVEIDTNLRLSVFFHWAYLYNPNSGRVLP